MTRGRKRKRERKHDTNKRSRYAIQFYQAKKKTYKGGKKKEEKMRKKKKKEKGKEFYEIRETEKKRF